MAEGKARKRSTSGEEAQIIPLEDGKFVDTTTGEILDEDSQTSGSDEYQDSPFDDLNQDGPLFDDSQATRDEFSQLGRNESAGRVIGAGRAA